MKNRFFQIIFFCLSQIAYSQGWVRYFDLIAPSTNVNIKLFCHQGYSASLDGQFFNYKIQNKSNNKLIITFDLVAKTICGTEVTCPIEITLNPLESYGGKVGQIQQIELLNQNVTKANCYLEEDVTYIDNKITKKAKNKISLVYVTHYKETVTIIEKPVKSVGKATKANNETMSDDEKLNQVLMAKMEQKFDDKNKQNTNSKKEKLANETPKSKVESTNINTKDFSIDKKIKNYKQQVVDILSNSEFVVFYCNGSHKKTVKYENCIWKGDELLTKQVCSFEKIKSYGNMNCLYGCPYENVVLDLKKIKMPLEILLTNHELNWETEIYFLGSNSPQMWTEIYMSDKTSINKLKEALNYIIENNNR